MKKNKGKSHSFTHTAKPATIAQVCRAWGISKTTLKKLKPSMR